MAKPTYKFPFSSILGKFGRVDASRGRDPGISADLFTQNGISVYRAPQNKTVSTSPAVQARSKIYCDCDEQWKFITPAQRIALPGWWMWARGRIGTPLPAYQTWMKGCLASLPEMPLFANFCWVGRYALVNGTGADIPAQGITLTGVPYAVPTGDDNEVWTLLGNSHLGEQVDRWVSSPGTLTIDIPLIPPGSSLQWDVYAYEVP